MVFDIATRLAVACGILIGVIHFSGSGIRPRGSRARCRIITSLVAGVLLYIIVRELIPEKEKGQPAFFAAGLASYVILAVLNAGAAG